MEFAVETTTYDSNHPHGGKSEPGRRLVLSNVGVALATDKWDDVYYPVEILRGGSQKLADGTFVGQTSFTYNDTSYGFGPLRHRGRDPAELLRPTKHELQYHLVDDDLWERHRDAPRRAPVRPGSRARDAAALRQRMPDRTGILVPSTDEVTRGSPHAKKSPCHG